jgi:hypothetical protein
MTSEELKKALDDVDHTRKKRMEMAEWVLGQANLIPILLQIAEKDEHPISSRACWVLEFAITNDLTLIFPYVEEFIAVLPKIRLESSVRPMAKICELITTSYFKSKNDQTSTFLKDEHLVLMATVCFDWLIGPYKVAPKAYSMASLFYLGQNREWIHEELKLVLEQNYSKGSAAYKARARMILAELIP